MSTSSAATKSRSSQVGRGNRFLARPGRRNRKALLFSYAMLVPAFVFLAVFIAWPFLQGLAKSFYNWNGGNVDVFVGFGNFASLVTNDPLFWPSIQNVLILTFAALLQASLVPLFASWLVHHFRGEQSKYLFRVLVMVPVVVPGVVTTLIWQGFLAQDGAVNRVLNSVGLHVLTHSWLGNPSSVLVGLILVNFPWLNGINCLLYLAAFGNIPKEIYEAAALDGSGNWRTFRKLELPFLSGQIRIILTLTLVTTFQSYQTIYILTDGGPADASVVPGLLLFRNAFSYGQLGYANAVGVVIAVMIMILLGVGLLFTRRRKEE